jgi:hypothetical protein
VPPSDRTLPAIVTLPPLASFALVIDPASIVFVTVPESLDPTSVPFVGKVTVVFPVSVGEKLYAPLYATLPLSVRVFPALATPVPPLAPDTTPEIPDAGAVVAAIEPLPVVVSVLPAPITNDSVIALDPSAAF